jgi:hypothetical protein
MVERVKYDTEHVCIWCRASFNESRLLKAHKEIEHPNRTYKTCEYDETCEFHTDAVGAMRIHIEAVHTNQRPFPCPECDYAAPKRASLINHMRRKHNMFNDKASTTRNKTESSQTGNEGSDGEPAANKLFLTPRRQNVLLVGEMDFTFSLSLTKQLDASLVQLTCTSFIDEEGYANTRISKKVRQVVRILKKRGATVVHGIDAQKLDSYSSLASFDESELNASTTLSPSKQYDAIVFCFPRQTTITGPRDENNNLLLKFLKSGLPLLNGNNPNAAFILLLHTCVLEGIPSDQYDEWEVGALAQMAGLHRTVKCKYEKKDFHHYEPRSRTGKRFVPDLAYFHVLERLPKNGNDLKVVE